ncbi:hypothetical protein K3148_05630 [Qipengyuania aurantiaca]|uniref:Sulfotransferase family protein n=1 Tax=Qipengyuania aurantiaca TaxID=2867233 RepID=A0ABX8ZPK1_9SPHN|nr:hypothetical protein [Qipengyuania aurantiaca]QZD90864.1 hypothetical protein K3148_05630 [Qipengyuania aurantiaca]
MGIASRIQRLTNNLKYAPDAYHFLHIGKAAGTQITKLADQYPRKVVPHPHDVSLKDLPQGASYFFSIRDPITRFYSGFYSRKRKGQPVYNVPWTESERASFRDFEHANDLAEALFDPGEKGIAATQAMVSIRHTGQNLVSWFFLQGNLLEVRPPVWIIRQEKFEEDFDAFLRKAGLNRPAIRPENRSHANNYVGTPALSEKAKKNLRRWFAQDYEFHRVCEAWLDTQTS